MLRLCFLVFVCLLLPPAVVPAGDTDPDYSFFESKIRPVLVEHCYECHAADSKEVRGGLLLDSRDGMRAGGDSGAVLVPGDPDNSLLIDALRYETLEMPPSQRLPDTIIADFEKWIRDGARDPRTDGVRHTRRAIDPDKAGEFWCFQPVQRPAIPDTDNGRAITEIDRFVERKCAVANLPPAPDASPEQIARRLYFGLTGLPPTPQQLTDFAVSWERSPDSAIDSTTDRLLQQPEFGERWGRHWLDVTRFAESSGGGRSLMHPHAWRFRDYVIQSFNADKPFDQLIREHIAGDLLPAADDVTHDEQITGSGYLILGAINYELQDKELLRMEVIDEQIDSLGRTFLGMTLGCARCHDHKFDPIPTTDYYALAGIFRSTQSLTPGNVSGHVTTPLQSGAAAKTAKEWQQESQLIAAELGALGKSQLTADERDRRQAELQKKQKAHHQAKPETPVAMSVRDDSQPADWHVHVRGGIRQLGPVVSRGVLSAVHSESLFSVPTHQSGRRQLADWIASPDNPLTSRVFVNRVWQHLIGEGLVRTPDNFGVTGQAPTHPELLDYLAHSFVHDDGWSVKSLIRRIVRSRAYRMASAPSESATATDPGNRVLSHAFRRRLDAEALRDAMLAISGRMSDQRSGRTIRKLQQYDAAYDHSRHSATLKSIFVPVFRNSRLELFDVFNGANPNVVSGRRTTGILPTQTLYLLNSPFVTEQSEAAARRFLQQQPSKAVPADVMIDAAFLTTIGRPPDTEERRVISEMLTHNSSDEWALVLHGLFASIDFRYLD